MTNSNNTDPHPNSDAMGELIDWDETERYLEIIRPINPEPIIAFWKQGKHFKCTGGVLPKEQISELLGQKPKPVGIIPNAALPLPGGDCDDPTNEISLDFGQDGVWGTKATQISHCVGVWAESDGGLTLEKQQELIKSAGFPEPSLTVWSGNKSLHNYWLMAQGEMLPPQLFRTMVKNCAAAINKIDPNAKIDSAIHNPNRVLRLPGFIHPEGGQRTKIHSVSDIRYTVEELRDFFERPFAPVESPRITSAPPRDSKVSGSIPLVSLLTKELNEAVLLGVPEGERNNTCYRIALNALAVFNVCKGRGITLMGTPKEVVIKFASHCSPPLDKAEALRTLQSAQNSECKIDPGFEKRLNYQIQRLDSNGVQGQSKQGSNGSSTGRTGDSESEMLSVDEVKTILKEEIERGVSDVEKETLIAQLGNEASIGPVTIQRIAESIGKEKINSIEVRAEAEAIAAESRRQEIGKKLTVDYLLPPNLARAVQVRTRSLPCDGPSSVLTFLAGIAGFTKLDTRVIVSHACRFVVPTNLYVALVAGSGRKKSPLGTALISEPSRKTRDHYREIYERDMRYWQANPQGEPEPRLKTLLINDYTAEALAEKLSDLETSGLGCILFRDELKGIMGNWGKYSNGRGAEAEQLLELYDGAAFNSIRVNFTRYYSKAQFSIYGAIQPEVLRGMVQDGDPNGLWARFCFVPLPETIVPINSFTSKEDAEAVARMSEVLSNCYYYLHELDPQDLVLSNEAFDFFADYEQNKQRLVISCPESAPSALHGKAAGKCARVAGLIHLLHGLTDRRPVDPEIPLDCVQRAADLIDFVDGWTLSFHIETSQGTLGAMRTIHKTAQSLGHPVKWKDIQQQLSRRQREKLNCGIAIEAMRALAQGGYGFIEEGPKGGISYKALKNLP